MADPIFDQVLNIAHGQQELQNMQNNSALVAAETKQIYRKMEYEDQFMRSMQMMAGAKLAQKDKAEGVTPKDNQPPSMRDINAQIENASQDYQTWSALAAVAPPSMAPVVEARVSAIQNTLQRLNTNRLAAQTKLDQGLGSAALSYAGASSPQEQQAALATLDKLDPNWSRDFDVDRETGTMKPIPGDKTAQALRIMALTKLPEAQQINAAKKAEDLRLAQQKFEQAQHEAALKDLREDAKEARAKEADARKALNEKEKRAIATDKAERDLISWYHKADEKQVANRQAIYMKRYGLTSEDAKQMAYDVLTSEKENLLANAKNDTGTKSDAEDKALADALGFLTPTTPGKNAYKNRDNPNKPKDEPGFFGKAWQAITAPNPGFVPKSSGKSEESPDIKAVQEQTKLVDQYSKPFTQKGIRVEMTKDGVQIGAFAGASADAKGVAEAAQRALARGVPLEAVLKRVNEWHP